jgi:hypothetical protein
MVRPPLTGRERLASKYRTDEDLDRLEATNAAIAAEGPLEDFLQANDATQTRQQQLPSR